MLGAARERRHGRERKQIAGGVIELLRGSGSLWPKASASAALKPLAVCTRESKPRRPAQGPSWP